MAVGVEWPAQLAAAWLDRREAGCHALRGEACQCPDQRRRMSVAPLGAGCR
ncbi:MAG: hypothetical protein ACKO3P_11625 [Planctomycetaceae bacterium]